MKLIPAFLFLVTSFAAAQNPETTISGKVASEGAPLPYTSIYVKGGSTGTSADAEGADTAQQTPDILSAYRFYGLASVSRWSVVGSRRFTARAPLAER